MEGLSSKHATTSSYTLDRHLIFYHLILFSTKLTFGVLGDLNSPLDPGVGAMTHDTEVTRLSATDFGSEVPGRAQQGFLGGVDVTGTSAPEYMTSSSAPQILALSMDSECGGAGGGGR